ncbi:hypothetical protein [Pandoraea communis]|uniref:hypothetical protein n=1 Tax=Pandoraea communis TaxID=2508297 RepID=UPI0025A55D23|nr:hypothetical protein [Pandoraea communis]MDM8356379.1 hypothetical protein [Pandoraea communis]
MATKGLDELQRRLRDLGNRVNELNGEHAVPMSELFPPAFLNACSRFSTVDELFSASGFTVNSPEDFAAIPDGDWDTFISQNTSYSSWEEMKADAAGNLARKRLAF